MQVSVSDVDITPQHLELLAGIIRRHAPGREVWAYGSRVSGKSWRYSDLDLVVLGEEPLKAIDRENLLDDLSETRIPYLIDLQDWSRVPESWREEIRRCYAVVHSPAPPDLS